MNISVIIPTFGRPKDLERCLEALQTQTRQANEVVIVFRPEDIATCAFLDGINDARVRKVQVEETGQVAALNAGLEAAQGAIVAITDDDTAPHPHWLSRIENHFSRDSRVGGVGGRDYLYREGILVDEAKNRVGVIQWFGRIIGNHHAGVGSVRDVEIIKGANMSYRKQAIAGLQFDRRLWGRGAQVCNDMAFSLAVKKRGWRIIYDPEVSIDHFPAIRHDDDQRHKFNAQAMTNAMHNEAFVLLNYLTPLRGFIYMLWAFLVGHRAGPGLTQWFRFKLKGDRDISGKLRAALKGRIEGAKDWVRSRR